MATQYERAKAVAENLGDRALSDEELRAFGDSFTYHWEGEALAAYGVESVADLNDDQVAAFALKKLKDFARDINIAAATKKEKAVAAASAAANIEAAANAVSDEPLPV